MNNYSVQKFQQGDIVENKFFEVFKALFKQSMIDIEAMFNDIYKSKIVGKVLYKNALMPLFSLMQESLFIQTFYKILEAEETVGSPNAYCNILYSIFGDNATITIDEKNPLHIQIDIVARYLEYFVWVDEKKEVYITTEQGEYLGFASLVARLTNRQLAEILKQVTNAGTYLEFTLQQGVEENGN